MSQKFLMLFLTSEDGVVSINFAARVLLGDTKNDITEHGRYKSKFLAFRIVFLSTGVLRISHFLSLEAKIRRLYDIANVLTSIGLIKKYQHQGLTISKPAYKYVGPQVDIMRGAECS
jgi:transcription factor E2F7/8